MKPAHLIAVGAACLAIASGAAHALEFKSVGSVPAILYDAPSAKGKKMFIAPRGMPVEVILVYGEWTKIRDAAGDLSWVESKALSGRRSVVVNVANAKIRAAADDSSPIVFTSDKGVLLDLAEPSVSGWVKIRHRDGQSGYVKGNEVWGE